MSTYTKILNAGTQAAYEALATKNPNLLYFCTDTGKLFKGSVDFTNNLVAVSTKPAAPIAGKVYVIADTDTVEVYVNNAWKVLSYPVDTIIDINSDDVHVASAKAVYDAIQKAVEGVATGANTVKSVEAGEADASVKVTKGDGTTTEVVIPGVATTPVWDSASRKLTIPVTGADDVVVNIGKDVFIDPTAQNGYNAETNTIDLYLNDGNGETESTKISIPAAALVDIYTGGTTSTATASVSDDNVVTVNVKLDPAATNGISVTANGLMVDLSAYAKTTDVEGLVDAVDDKVTELTGTVNANSAAIAKLNADSSEAGSVAYQVAQAKAALEVTDQDHERRIGALEAKDTTIQTSVETNTTNIASLAEATTEWGSF